MAHERAVDNEPELECSADVKGVAVAAKQTCLLLKVQGRLGLRLHRSFRPKFGDMSARQTGSQLAAQFLAVTNASTSDDALLRLGPHTLGQAARPASSNKGESGDYHPHVA